MRPTAVSRNRQLITMGDSKSSCSSLVQRQTTTSSRRRRGIRCRPNSMNTKTIIYTPFLLWVTCCQKQFLTAMEGTHDKSVIIKGSTIQRSRKLLRSGENVFYRMEDKLPGKIKGNKTLKRKSQYSNFDDTISNSTSLPMQTKSLPESDPILSDGTQTRQGVNTCQLNEQGFYGDTSDTSDSNTTVNYLYQVSVEQGTSAVILNTVIPQVDRAITTAMLPSFFDCSGNRKLQTDGTVLAISSQPIDSFAAFTCPRIIPNSDCYIGQGSTTAITTGLSRRQVNQQVKDAAQLAMQSSELLNSIPSNLVLDITPLTDDQLTFAPVGSQTSQPVASRPSTLTFAPYPLLTPSVAPAPSPEIEVTFPPTNMPIIRSPSSSTETEQPTISFGNTQEPSASLNDENKSKGAKNVDWWAWLLASVGGVIVLAGFMALFKRLGSRQPSPTLSPNESLPVDIGCLGIGSQKMDFKHEKSGAATSSSNRVPPIAGAFSISPGPSFSNVENDKGQFTTTNYEVEQLDDEDEASEGAEGDVDNGKLEEEDVLDEEEVEEANEDEIDQEEEVEEEDEEELDYHQEIDEEGQDVVEREESYHDLDDEGSYYEEEITEEETSQDKWPSSQ